MSKKKKILKKIAIIAAAVCLLAGAAVVAVSAYVKSAAKPWIMSAQQAQGLNADCILILGCGVRETGEPSLMLRDRLDMGLTLYELGAAPKLLMSGDHGRETYDEVNTMKDYAMERGVPSEDVFMDHAGFSTYESMYRAKEVFQVKTVIIVSQKYHLYRAVYDARALGLDAYGVAAEDIAYLGQAGREVREILARTKDVFYCIFQPTPTFLGDPIPVWGSGDVTND